MLNLIKIKFLEGEAREFGGEASPLSPPPPLDETQIVLTSRLDTYFSRYGDFYAHNNNDNDTTNYFTPYACALGNKSHSAESLAPMVFIYMYSSYIYRVLFRGGGWEGSLAPPP